ncbi:hypothetical protein OBE_16265, partial [human gut metagenome]
WTIPEGEKYDIIQGCFEKSNVDANKEITSLMETQRLFEARQCCAEVYGYYRTAERQAR